MTKRTFCTLLMSAGLIGGILAGSATPLLAADKKIKSAAISYVGRSFWRTGQTGR